MLYTSEKAYEFQVTYLHIDDNFQIFSQSSFPSVNKKEIDKLGELKRCNLRAINMGFNSIIKHKVLARPAWPDIYNL